MITRLSRCSKYAYILPYSFVGIFSNPTALLKLKIYMAIDISKYLYRCNQMEVDPTHRTKFDQIKSHLEACVELGLGISGLVNKLSHFIAASAFHQGTSPAIKPLAKLFKKKMTEKNKLYKRKRSLSPNRYAE